MNLGREYYRDLAAHLALLGAPRLVRQGNPPAEKVVEARQKLHQRKLNRRLHVVEARAVQQGCGEREITRRMAQCAADRRR